MSEGVGLVDMLAIVIDGILLIGSVSLGIVLHMEWLK